MEEGEKVKKSIFKKWWFWAIIVVVLIAFASSGDDKSTQTTTQNAGKTTQQQTEKTYKVGDSVQVGKLTYKVNSVQKLQQVGSEYLNKKANGIFVVANISVTNNDTEARTLDTNMFQLKQGSTTYNCSGDATIYANDQNNFFLQEINPNLTITGVAVFDVPVDAASLSLVVQNSFWGTSTENIDLGI